MDAIAFTVKECRRCGGRERYANGKCATCARARDRERRESGKHAQYQAAWRAKNPRKDWEYHLRNRYGLTPAEYQRLHDAQGGVCAICGKAEVWKDRHGNERRLVVDHDHETNEVRGLLCYVCNKGIGMLKDDVSVLLSAVEYLQRGRSSSRS